MGLTIARRLLEAHGGSIHLIQDGRRRGANFRVRLPRKRSRATFYNGQ
jgi:signal transduction histidine kinase